jgi:hypothetical protein
MSEIFDSIEKATYFVYLEAIIVFVIFLQFIQFLGIRVQNGSLLFFTNIVSEIEVYLFLLNILFFFLIFTQITLKSKKVQKLHTTFSELVLGKAKEKVFGIERHIIIFLIFQYVFAFIVAIAIAFYLDPEIEFPGFSQVAFPFNLIAFILFLGFGFYIFSVTKPFRDEVYDSGFLQKKLMPAHRLFPTKRITNKRTGSIRIKSSKK